MRITRFGNVNREQNLLITGCVLNGEQVELDGVLVIVAKEPEINQVKPGNVYCRNKKEKKSCGGKKILN